MKESALIFKEKTGLEKKLKRLQKYNTRKYWIGWAGGYGDSKKTG